MKNKILIVDDMKINQDVLIALLNEKYDIITASDGREAINIIEQNYRDISLILLDLIMPVVDGFEVLAFLNSKNKFHIPVIIITAKSEHEYEKRGLNMGANDFITKPFDPDIVRLRVDSQVNLREYQTKLENLVDKKVEQLSNIWIDVLQSMAEVIESRNGESGQHTKRTSLITRYLIQSMNQKGKSNYYFTPRDTQLVYQAACLHDVGKISIPDSILTKPDKLTDSEFEIMKTHTTLGADIAKKITSGSELRFQEICNDIVLYHHERWDGTGYPCKLAGEKIPLAARIVSISDSYDAITNDRIYRKSRSHNEAVKIITEMAGRQFDPFLVEVFLEIEKDLQVLIGEKNA